MRCAQNLQGDDLACLVEYLDKVCCRVALPNLRSNQHRHSTVSTLPVPLPGSVCANSEAYAGIRRYFRHPTRFHPTF